MGLLDDIKKEAAGKGIKIQNSEERDIETRLNKLFYLDKNIPEETKFINMVMTRGQETAERKGLHASAIIGSDETFCYRQQVLSLFYKQSQGEQFSPKLKRIFAQGDAIHEKWQRLFIRGGYARPIDCDVTQYDKRYDLQFTPDIIANIDGETYVVEIKSVNTMQFQKMVKEGKEHESGKKQLQLYMRLLGIDKGFVLCEDKNTQDFKVSLYDIDYSVSDKLIERLKEIRRLKCRLEEKGRLKSRIQACYAYNCPFVKSCPMRDVCWGKSKEKI